MLAVESGFCQPPKARAAGLPKTRSARLVANGPVHIDKLLAALKSVKLFGAPAKEPQAQKPIQRPALEAAPAPPSAVAQATQYKTWVYPGHYYSPIVDPHNPQVQRVLAGFPHSELAPNDPTIIDTRVLLDTFHRISRYYSQLPFPDEKSPEFRYYYNNPAFSYGDASVYFGMLLDLRPQRIVEIGSGFSSCLAMDVNDRFLNRETQLTFIDPHPDTLRSLLSPDDPYLKQLVAAPVQDVPTKVFAALRKNDILFIDSSHVSKLASDVNDYLFRILPALARGVVIHIHDIPYPFEYGRDWIEVENRSWNEAYALHAFLEYNQAFSIIYFSHFMNRRYPHLLRERACRIA